MHPERRRMRGGRRGRSAEGPDAARLRRAEGRRRRSTSRRGGDADRRQAARRHRAAEGGALRDPAAEDALGQDAAPLDPGARRGPRPGRPHHHRGSQRPRTDQGRPCAHEDNDRCSRSTTAARSPPPPRPKRRRTTGTSASRSSTTAGICLHLIRMDGAIAGQRAHRDREGQTAAETRRSTAGLGGAHQGRPQSMLGMPEITPGAGRPADRGRRHLRRRRRRLGRAVARGRADRQGGHRRRSAERSSSFIHHWRRRSHEVDLAVSQAVAFALAFSACGAAAQPACDAVPDKMPNDIPYGAPISLDRAQQALNAALAESKKRGWKLNVAVVDSGGEPGRLRAHGRRAARLDRRSPSTRRARPPSTGARPRPCRELACKAAQALPISRSTT